MRHGRLLALILAVLVLGAPQVRAAYPEPIVLEINGWKYPNGRDQSNESFFAKFEAANPGIKIKVTGAPYTDWLVALRARMQAGDIPDVLLMQHGALIREFSPLLTPVDNFVKGTETDPSRYVKTAVDQITIDGKIMGLPGIMGVESPVYNRLAFEKAHVDKVPRTYSELKDAAAKCRAAGLHPFLITAKDVWNMIDLWEQTAIQFGGDLMYRAEAGKVKWTDPVLVKATQAFGELYVNGVGWDGALSTGVYPGTNDVFTEGKSCMIEMGSWMAYLVEGFRPATSPQVYVLPVYLPDMTGGKGKEWPVVLGGVDQIFTVPKGTKHLKEAVKFAQWMSLNITEFGGDPGAIPALKQGRYCTCLNIVPGGQKRIDEWWGWYTKALDKAWRRELLYPSIKSTLEKALQGVASRQLTPEGAMEQVEAVSATTTRR